METLFENMITYEVGIKLVIAYHIKFSNRYRKGIKEKPVGLKQV